MAPADQLAGDEAFGIGQPVGPGRRWSASASPPTRPMPSATARHPRAPMRAQGQPFGPDRPRRSSALELSDIGPGADHAVAARPRTPRHRRDIRSRHWSAPGPRPGCPGTPRRNRRASPRGIGRDQRLDRFRGDSRHSRTPAPPSSRPRTGRVSMPLQRDHPQQFGRAAGGAVHRPDILVPGRAAGARDEGLDGAGRQRMRDRAGAAGHPRVAGIERQQAGVGPAQRPQQEAAGVDDGAWHRDLCRLIMSSSLPDNPGDAPPGKAKGGPACRRSPLISA